MRLAMPQHKLHSDTIIFSKFTLKVTENNEILLKKTGLAGLAAIQIHYNNQSAYIRI